MCRTVTKEHIPKKHLDFENPITGKAFDNTNVRIYGEAKPEIMTTNNTEYGVGRNKADGIAKVGRKTTIMEKEIEAQVALEMQAKREEEARRNAERYFDTTGRETYTQQDMTANVVGRKVMKT